MKPEDTTADRNPSYTNGQFTVTTSESMEHLSIIYYKGTETLTHKELFVAVAEFLQKIANSI